MIDRREANRPMFFQAFRRGLAPGPATLFAAKSRPTSADLVGLPEAAQSYRGVYLKMACGSQTDTPDIAYIGMSCARNTSMTHWGAKVREGQHRVAWRDAQERGGDW